jgi:hypothetical protein
MTRAFGVAGLQTRAFPLGLATTERGPQFQQTNRMEATW